MRQKEYDYRISNIRALAILAVVFGHSIIIYDTSWGYYTAAYQVEILQAIKHFINTFQMPLFFSISGYCFHFSAKTIRENGYMSFVKGKMKRLLIPFAGIAILWMIPLRLMSLYPYWQRKSLKAILVDVVTGRDSGHLWYLASLFLIFLIAGIIEIAVEHINDKTGNSWRNIFISIAILIGAATLAPIVPNIFFFRDVAKYLIWFYFGYYMYLCMRNGKEKALLLTAITIIIAAAVSAVVAALTEGMNPLQSLKSNAIGALVTGMMYLLVPSRSFRLLSILSDNSFGIYLLHSPLIYPVFCYLSWIRPLFVVTLTFGVMFPLSMVITILLKGSKVGRNLIGEK